VLYYDGQSFLVPATSNVLDLSQLNGATICTVKATTHEANLADYFRARAWTYQPVIVETQDKAAEALFSGQCQAFTSERPQLTAMRLKAPGGPDEYLIVRWVLFALIRAEEMGITRSNVLSRLEATTDPMVQRWLDLDRIISKGLTVPPGWATRALESVGNYGEMFERNFGSQSVLKLERGLNGLWTHGGLMYAPPFR
jgi:general L-amino acid transport system substrate-binding protein